MDIFPKTEESNEVLQKFKEFKALVENHTRKKIKTLRLDNGGEYTFNIFKELCISIEIKRETTIPYNPQQNEVAGRKNRTIIEAAKAMIQIEISLCLFGPEQQIQQYTYKTEALM